MFCLFRLVWDLRGAGVCLQVKRAVRLPGK